MDLMLFDQVGDLEQGGAHFYPQGLQRLVTGDKAAVIVAQHPHRLVPQIWAEHTFATDIKRIAVHQGKQRRHGTHNGWMTLVTTPQITSSSLHG